jgi:MbtH protein
MTHSGPDAGDTTIYKVVVNRTGQYSVWPEWSEEPGDWRSVAVSGPKSECLAYIEAVWTDIRPLSLRCAMERANAAPVPATEPELDERTGP